MKPLQLLFVYNANSDLFSTVTDFVHKIISPKTYSCSLCSLTFGNLLIKQQWKDFLNQLTAEKVFLHKDEFLKKYNSLFQLPAIFYLQKNQPISLVSFEEINACKDLKNLQELLLQRVQQLQITTA